MTRTKYEMSPFERGEIEGLEGKPGPAFPTSQSPWNVRLHNRGWESGAGKRMKFAEQVDAAKRANAAEKRSTLDQFLPADEYGDDFGR